MAATRTRRTQAERRAATRGALLDAALAALIEDGYANMTTRRVADRAGVSQGTQQHYFASKQDFVLEAMRYAVERLAGDVTRRIDVPALLAAERYEELLDELWRLHTSPTFLAAIELWSAARTDAELRKALRTLERDVSKLIGAMAEEGAGPALDLALATIRGYAMLAPVVSRAELGRRWAAARPTVAALLRA